MPFILKWKASGIADLEKQHEKRGAEVPGNETVPLAAAWCSGPLPRRSCFSGWLCLGTGSQPKQRTLPEEPCCSAGPCHRAFVRENRALVSSGLGLRKPSLLAVVSGLCRQHTGTTPALQPCPRTTSLRVPEHPRLPRTVSRSVRPGGLAGTDGRGTASGPRESAPSSEEARVSACLGSDPLLARPCTGSRWSCAWDFQRLNRSRSVWSEKRGPAPEPRWLVCLSGQARAVGSGRVPRAGRAARALAGHCLRAQTGTAGRRAPLQAWSVCSARTAAGTAPARADVAEALAKWRVAAVVISGRPNRIFTEAKMHARGPAC